MHPLPGGAADAAVLHAEAAALFAARDFAAARSRLQALAAAMPGHPGVWQDLAIALNNDAAVRLGGGDAAAAAALLRLALSIDPALPRGRAALVGALLAQARAAAAAGAVADGIAPLRRAVAVDGGDATARKALGELLNRRALALIDDGAMADAAAAALEAAALVPPPSASGAPVAAAFLAAGKRLVELGRHAEALECYAGALVAAPGDREAHYYKMFAHRWLRDYAAAWDPAVWRDVYCRAAPRLWDGREAVEDMLIVHRNGIGDFLQFARYIPEFAGRFGRIGLYVDPRCRPLLRHPGLRLFGEDVAAKINLIDDFRTAPYDRYCELFGLCLATGRAPRELTVQPPYLSVEAGFAASWRGVIDAHAGGRRLRVGLVWGAAGGSSNPRSVDAAAIRPLVAAFPDIQFTALQADAAKGQLFDGGAPDNLLDLGIYDIGATAAILNALDLAVVADTGIAHLAGALGVETWMLLGNPCDWRWHSAGSRSDWYPTARLFRQKPGGGWDSAIAEVVRALRRRAEADRWRAARATRCPDP